MEDQGIIELFFKRRENALRESQMKYGKRLYRTANNILRNEEDANECVNDALLKAWNTIPPEQPRFLGAFLTKIIRNLAINKWNAQRAQKRGGGEMDLLLGELQDCITDPLGTEQVLDSKHVVNAINDYLESEDKITRVMFVLRYFHGEEILSIAHQLKLTESNVKSKLFRVRKKLAIHLGKEGITL